MTKWKDLRRIGRFAPLFLFAVCAVPAKEPAPAPDVVVNEASFRCIREMTKVRGLYIDNLLGNLAGSVAVAKSPEGKTYPPGTLIQVIPTVALVKHQPGRNPETNDWEFIELNPTAAGTTITGRGYAELNMPNGANCFGCHKPAKASWDLICEQTHGCPPVAVTPVMMSAMRNTDPRCPKIDLPKEEADALAALAASRAPPPAK